MKNAAHKPAGPREVFNWGYHDGANDTLDKRYRHVADWRNHSFWGKYYQGYVLGKRDAQEGAYQAMGNNPTSAQAWDELPSRTL